MTKEQIAWQIRWQLGRLGINANHMTDDQVIEGVTAALERWSTRIVLVWNGIAEAWRKAWGG